MTSDEFALMLSGFLLGVALTVTWCNWLAQRDHREWSRIVDDLHKRLKEAESKHG